MKSEKLICVLCPNSCEIILDMDNGNVTNISGDKCIKGKEWALDEIKNKKRILTYNVLVKGGDFPLVSVKTDKAVLFDKIPAIVEDLKKIKLTAPVKIGDVVKNNPAGIICNIIATRNI